MAHVLDTAVWSALTGAWADRALVNGRARRLAPAFGLFVATADDSPAALAQIAALAGEGPLFMMQPSTPDAVPGLEVVSRACGLQMVQETGPETSPPATFEIVRLEEEDAAEMLALATLTRPGPFFERTHELGEFVGVKVDGRLAAMAGERLKVPGYTEVSGVCTHPDHRGRGYAAALMERVAEGIRARGETPILHTYADNAGAIALYERLGYRTRTEVIVTALQRPA